MNGQTIIDAVTQVTATWAKVRKAEEREHRRMARRREALVRSHRETIRDVAWDVMEPAYRKASANDTLPAHARQIMYAARGAIQARTARTLDDQYFCQTLLPDYLMEHPNAAAAWDVVFDARGHFEEPHTGCIVPLGTLDVRQYLTDVTGHTVPPLAHQLTGGKAYPTCGPPNRYGAILFIEKEGFLPLFRAVHLAERYDLAIMSTKGMSVVASRQLVDALCKEVAARSGRQGVPLLVLHDFDKAGFSILGTLQRDTRRYEFEHPVQVIDLGLRLRDVQAHHLDGEDVAYGKVDPRRNLRENDATEDEIAYLCQGDTPGRGYVGRRVELNAFPSDRLIAWIEAKLTAVGVKKVVPDRATLTAAYRRILEAHILQGHLEDVADEAKHEAEAARIPRSRARMVREGLKADPELPWDAVLSSIVSSRLERAEP